MNVLQSLRIFVCRLPRLTDLLEKYTGVTRVAAPLESFGASSRESTGNGTIVAAIEHMSLSVFTVHNDGTLCCKQNLLEAIEKPLRKDV